MGHPVEALVWLTTLFARHRKKLQAGMIVMTGSVIPTKFVSAGNDVRFVTDKLGEVRLRVE